VTGRGYGGFRKQTELWPKTDSQCTLPNFPLEIYGAVGFWTAQGPTVCGGSDGENRTNKCFIFKNQQWMAWTNMGTARQWASALQINPIQALIIGGWDENENDFFPESQFGHDIEQEFEFAITCRSKALNLESDFKSRTASDVSTVTTGFSSDEQEL